MPDNKGPQFVRFFGPVLQALRSLGGSGQPSEVKDWIANKLAIKDKELKATVGSGATRYSKQVDWARFYLSKALLLDSSVRGVWTLTEKGRKTTLSQDAAVTLFRKIHKLFEGGSRRKKNSGSGKNLVGVGVDYREECLHLLTSLPSAGFERFSQEMLRESGFESVTVTGKSGDGGIDGIGVLQLNALVSFKVLFQCKRYTGSIGPDKVRDFRGAMMGRADKGIIISTGSFTAEARREAVRDGVPPIELVDGDKLIDMMQNLRLGLKPVSTFEVDPAYFVKFE